MPTVIAIVFLRMVYERFKGDKDEELEKKKQAMKRSDTLAATRGVTKMIELKQEDVTEDQPRSLNINPESEV